MSVSNVTPPAITGSAVRGSTLTSSQGTWTFSLDYLTYAYQWERCDSGGASCVDIGGATSQTYVVQNADVGSTIRVKVTATEHSNTGAANPLGFLRYCGKPLMSHVSDYETRIQSPRAFEGRPVPSFVYSDPWTATVGATTAGIDYATAHANGWTLQKSGGGEIFIPAFNSYLVDVGNSAYRTAWVNALISKCSSEGFSGIFMDNVLTYKNTSCPSYSTAYPNDPAVRAAQLAWNVHMEPIIHGAGLQIVGNANAMVDTSCNDSDCHCSRQWYLDVGPYLDYIMIEYFMFSGQNCAANPDPDCVRRAGDTQWYNHWEAWLGTIPYIYTSGAKPIGLVKGTSTRRQGYTAASFLLQWDHTKGGNITWCSNNDYCMPTTDPWDALWDEVVLLGTPTGAYTVSSGTYQRVFTGGTVKVNPTTGTWQIRSLS